MTPPQKPLSKRSSPVRFGPEGLEPLARGALGVGVQADAEELDARGDERRQGGSDAGAGIRRVAEGGGGEGEGARGGTGARGVLREGGSGEGDGGGERDANGRVKGGDPLSRPAATTNGPSRSFIAEVVIVRRREGRTSGDAPRPRAAAAPSAAARTAIARRG